MIKTVLFWLTTIIILVLFLSILLLQTPVVQNYLVDQIIEKLNERTPHHAEIEEIKVKWFDYVEIKGLTITDYNQSLMIEAERLTIDYELSALLDKGNISLDLLDIYQGQLHLINYDDSLNINLIEFIRDELEAIRGGKKKPNEQPGTLSVGKIRLDDFIFSYDNRLADSLPDSRFDYGHFALDIPGGTFGDLYIHGDTVKSFIRSLAFKDRNSSLELTKLTSAFMLTQNLLSFTDLNLVTPKSQIRDRVVLSFSGIEDLSFFQDSVSMDINLVGSEISMIDLRLFTSLPFENFKSEISASIQGSVPRLSLEDLSLRIGQSYLEGNVEFLGLPKLEETFIEARVSSAHFHPKDLDPFIENGLEVFQRFGDIDFSGRFLGFTNDFVSNASFETALGSFSSDLNFKFPKKWQNATYSGSLTLDDFHVGKLIDDTISVQRVNLTGNIDGRGLLIENARFYLNADIWESVLLGYTYREISVSGNFASEHFDGYISVNDPNAQIQTSGNIDLNKGEESFKLSSDISYLNLNALGFIQDQMELKANLSADIEGLNLDSLQGDILINDLDVVWNRDSLRIDTLKVYSMKYRDQREIGISMPEIEARMEGNFLFSQLIKDFNAISEDLKHYFQTDYQGGQSANSGERFEEYAVDFSVNYSDLNKYLKLLPMTVFVSENGVVEGTYYQRKNATLSVFAESDSINYDGVGYIGNVLDLNLSKDLDSLGIIASVFINSEKQAWKHIPTTENLSIEAVWFNDKINFNGNISQPENNNSADINGQLQLSKSQLIFSFLPSRLIAFGDRWFFNPFNKVIYSQGTFKMDRLELYQNDQSILLKGIYADSSESKLNLSLQNVDLNIINGLVPVALGGVVNSSMIFKRDRVGEDFIITSDLSISEFTLNDFLVGNVLGESGWNPSANGLEVDLDIERESVQTISLHGFFKPQEAPERQFDLKAKFNKANLTLIQPWFVGLFSGIAGDANGEVTISGNPSYPVIKGTTEVSNGRFNFDYLGTSYTLNGDLTFDNDIIKFNGLRLNDKEGDPASLSGTLTHNGFKSFAADLRIAASNFQFLNTTSSDNSLYYGSANATGDIYVSGPVNDLLIKAKITSNKDTKIYIPLAGTSEVGQKDYIRFVDFSDSTTQVNVQEILANTVSGIRLDFDMDITTDAYVELIFDIRTGDIIRGRGSGNLNLTLDTNGEFELFGDLTIEEGAYNFTVPNLISKEFKVVPGGTISWYGDPYKGEIDLTAQYRQLASFQDYYAEEVDVPAQKFPILVIMKLNGEMLSPNIDFAIEMEGSQNTQTGNITKALEQMNVDEQELKRQVFSLLILRRFSPQSSLVGTGAAVGGSLSEFLSNQFSYFVSQVDENLEVDLDVDLGSLDQNSFNTFQLRLAYTFLDGRLRVSGGGAYSELNADQTNAVFGDWSVRYLLTEDGHLRVKAFRQNEQIANTFQYETGVSFQYVKSFNDFKELLSKTREEAVRVRNKDVSKENREPVEITPDS